MDTAVAPLSVVDLEKQYLLQNYARFPLVLHRGKGCSACNFTGYRGRLGIYELLVPNADIRDAILLKRTMQEIRQISLDSCALCTMQEDGMVKALRGVTTLEEVLENAPRVFHHRPLDTLLEIVG